MASKPTPISDPIPWDAVATPLSGAEDALARFDERLRTSPIRDGVVARLDFADACACLWLAGELVTPEDLVLHDAERDLRIPSFRRGSPTCAAYRSGEGRGHSRPRTGMAPRRPP